MFLSLTSAIADMSFRFSSSTCLLQKQLLAAGEPNNDSPLNEQAASLWANQEEYRHVLNKKYNEGRS